MKIFIKLICFIPVLGLAGPFILRSPTGEPYWDYRDIAPNWSDLQSPMKRWWNNIGAEPSEHGDLVAKESGDNVNALANIHIYR